MCRLIGVHYWRQKVFQTLKRFEDAFPQMTRVALAWLALLIVSHSAYLSSH